MAVATSTHNTLRKLGADLRWLVEKCGVAPELIHVAIVVRSQAEVDKIAAGFEREFDAASMERGDRGNKIVVHGVRIAAVILEKA
jgi:hypothetical protein